MVKPLIALALVIATLAGHKAVDKADALIAEGKVDKAREHLEKETKEDPGSWEVLTALGRLSFTCGPTDTEAGYVEAEEVLRRATRIAPEEAEPFAWLGRRPEA